MENTILDKFCWPLHKTTVASNLPVLLSHVQGLSMVNFTGLEVCWANIPVTEHELGRITVMEGCGVGWEEA